MQLQSYSDLHLMIQYRCTRNLPNLLTLQKTNTSSFFQTHVKISTWLILEFWNNLYLVRWEPADMDKFVFLSIFPFSLLDFHTWSNSKGSGVTTSTTRMWSLVDWLRYTYHPNSSVYHLKGFGSRHKIVTLIVKFYTSHMWTFCSL